uniref:Uncharacterized protein n=1 Tax=Timema monikensis TaxID=170555 RepID=A0A7R9HQW8_9NEOP|nr:unnamed protein product [Timema monikensis]
MCGPQPLPQWIQPGFRPPTHLNGEYHHHHHHHYQQQHQHLRWDHDPYNGLMTTKERQWLYNIQQLQLSTDKPYIDDYYYTVFVSRRGDPTGGSFVTEHRERRDSVRDKPYTPMQFQNSLGKLQAGSVTSPRKLLDLEVVSNEGLDCPTTAPPKDTQRCKQMLLEIEKLYLLLLKLEDSVSPHLEAREIVTETKQELLTNIFTSLLHKDWLVAIMSYRKGKVSTIMSYRKGKVSTIMSYKKGKVSTIMSYKKGKVSTIMSYRKGKMLILRLLPHLAQPEVDHQLCGVWVRILGGLPAVSRRDGPLLTHLYPHYKQWLERATPVRVLQLCSSLVSDQGPMRSSRLFLVVGNKFGISALKAILERMQVMYPSLEPHLREEWSSFLSTLMAAIQLAASVRSLSPPIEVMDAGVLSRHLQDWSEDSSNMCALFERAFASQPIIK